MKTRFRIIPNQDIALLRDQWRWALKEQYVGDGNDYRKYALLRALADGGRTKIGVAWMLTPPDDRNDGKMLAYLNKPEFRGYDPELFDLMKLVSKLPPGHPRLTHIEASSIVPAATYFNSLTPDDRPGRAQYFAQLMVALASTDLVFFDPDNGLDVASKAIGAKGSSKYLYRSELRRAFETRHSVLVYQHFPHEDHAKFIERLGSEVGEMCPGAQIWAFATAHVVFLLAINPRHSDTLGSSADAAAARWPTSFIGGRRITRVEDKLTESAPDVGVSTERPRVENGDSTMEDDNQEDDAARAKAFADRMTYKAGDLIIVYDAKAIRLAAEKNAEPTKPTKRPPTT
jgi:hypothetical protein